jgi:hypothetical protein
MLFVRHGQRIWARISIAALGTPRPPVDSLTPSIGASSSIGESFLAFASGASLVTLSSVIALSVAVTSESVIVTAAGWLQLLASCATSVDGGVS